MQRRKLASENVEHKNNNGIVKFLKNKNLLQTPVKGNVLSINRTHIFHCNGF